MSLQNVSKVFFRKFCKTSIKFRPIISATIDNETETIKVKFSEPNSTTASYPWIYLQDNCTCTQCYHPSSQSRLRLLNQLDPSNKLTSIELDKSNANINCSWEKGHNSKFSEQWLRERQFKGNISPDRLPFRNIKQSILWGKLQENPFKIPQMDFDNVLNNPKTEIEFLKTLASTGMIILNGSPQIPGTLRKFVDNIFGFPRTTHYGHQFTVQSKPNASNLAYTSGTLNLHTDLPYYVSPPGVQLLHCIKQIPGESDGVSTMVDAFSVGKFMQEEMSEEYKILCSVPVEFRDVGADFIQFHKIHQSTTFVHDSEENLNRIIYSNQLLSSCQTHLDVETVKKFYKALKAFDTICNHPNFLLKFKLEPGQIVIFDNWRCLHGREGFDPQAGERHLEGAYVDWDEVESRIRVLLDNSN